MNPTSLAPPTADRNVAERVARLVLHHAAEAGDSLLCRLVESFGAQVVAEALRSGTGPDLLPPSDEETAADRVSLISRTRTLRIRCERANPDADIAVGAAAKAHYCIPGDSDWPDQLSDLGDTVPLGLWLSGNADLRPTANRCVAIVGARSATDYGMHIAAEIAVGLAERNWIVVSGAAKGIDGAAHRGALAGRGLTAAVLACGIDQVYPLGHHALLSAIASEGIIVSELPPGTTVSRYRFLDRNRLIAALGRGTVVVEAAARSGSLVTARLADEIGRPVLAVPGPVTSELSAGTHQLIRDGGALLVTRAEEVVEHLGELGTDIAPPVRGATRPRDVLDPIASRVLEALPPQGRGSSDVLEAAIEAGVEPREAHAALGRLAATGWVDRDGSGWFARRRS
jgi:DNA processing protein